MGCSALKCLRYFQESGFVKSIFCLEHLWPVELNWAAAGADCGAAAGGGREHCVRAAPRPLAFLFTFTAPRLPSPVCLRD